MFQATDRPSDSDNVVRSALAVIPVTTGLKSKKVEEWGCPGMRAERRRRSTRWSDGHFTL